VRELAQVKKACAHYAQLHGTEPTTGELSDATGGAGDQTADRTTSRAHGGRNLRRAPPRVAARGASG
jgi:hypothetical protein